MGSNRTASGDAFRRFALLSSANTSKRCSSSMCCRGTSRHFVNRNELRFASTPPPCRRIDTEAEQSYGGKAAQKTTPVGLLRRGYSYAGARGLAFKPTPRRCANLSHDKQPEICHTVEARVAFEDPQRPRRPGPGSWGDEMARVDPRPSRRDSLSRTIGASIIPSCASLAVAPLTSAASAHAGRPSCWTSMACPRAYNRSPTSRIRAIASRSMLPTPRWFASPHFGSAGNPGSRPLPHPPSPSVMPPNTSDLLACFWMPLGDETIRPVDWRGAVGADLGRDIAVRSTRDLCERGASAYRPQRLQ